MSKTERYGTMHAAHGLSRIRVFPSHLIFCWLGVSVFCLLQTTDGVAEEVRRLRPRLIDLERAGETSMTTERLQFEALVRYPSSEDHGDLSRERVLARYDVPKEHRSPAAVREGAKTYLRRIWEHNWHIRKLTAEEQAEDPGLENALREYLGQEEKLYAVAAGLSFDFEELRPTVSDTTSLIEQLSQASSAGMQEQWSLLSRVLLYPADGKLTQAIVDFAAGIPSTSDDRRRPGWWRYPQWKYVGWSPDPQMKQALINYACSEKGRIHAEAVCYSLLTGGIEHTYASLSEAQIRRLFNEVPEDLLAPAVAVTGRIMIDTFPVLREMAFEAEPEGPLQMAIVKALKLDAAFSHRLFAEPWEPAEDAMRRRFLEVHEGPGVPPSGVALDRIVTDQRVPMDMRLSALRVMSHWLTGPSRINQVHETRMVFEQLLSDDSQPELQTAARELMQRAEERQKEAETHGPGSEHFRALTRSREPSADEIITKARTSLALLDQMREQEDSKNRRIVQLILVQGLSKKAHQALEQLWSALQAYASTNNGRLPEKLAELDWAPQDDPDVDIAYLAGPGMRIDQLGPVVILAACRQPFPRESYFGPHLRVMVLKGDGKVEELSFEQLGKGWANEKFAPRVFREVWAQSQASRAKLGLPPADPAQLGAAAAFLATSTQPASAPAAEPSISGDNPEADTVPAN